MLDVTEALLCGLARDAASSWEEGLLRLTDRGPNLDWSSDWYPACEAGMVLSGFVVGRLVELERREDGSAYVALRDVPADALRLLLAEAVATLAQVQA